MGGEGPAKEKNVRLRLPRQSERLTMETRRQTLQAISIGRWDRKPEASAFGPDWRAAAILRFLGVSVLIHCDATLRYRVGFDRITRAALWRMANKKLRLAKLPVMKRIMP